MNRNFKKIGAAALAAVMCVALAGCGNSEADPFATASGGESKATSKVKVDPNKKQISPFDDLQVTFTGTIPNSRVNISGGNYYVEYTANKTSGVKNGDEIEVTAKLSPPSLEDEFQLLETSKTYTVSGLSAYAMKLADIPDETMSKMDKQAEDLIRANTAAWDAGNTMTSLDKLGYYMLAAKEGFTPSPTNTLYCVYKINAHFDKGCTEEEFNQDKNNAEKDGGDDAFYIYVSYKDILLLADGTCSVDLSSGSLCSNRIKTLFGQGGFLGGFVAWEVQGYRDVDSMYNAVVAKNIANYDYENTVKEG